MERVRLLADYTGEAVDVEKAAWAVDQAASFVETVQRTFDARKSRPQAMTAGQRRSDRGKDK